MDDESRAVLAALNDAFAAYEAAAKGCDAAAQEYDRASAAAIQVLVRRAAAAEAEVEQLRAEIARVRQEEREACAKACDDVAQGADNALVDATIPRGVTYLKGRRRGAEVCAEKIRGRERSE